MESADLDARLQKLQQILGRPVGLSAPPSVKEDQNHGWEPVIPVEDAKAEDLPEWTCSVEPDYSKPMPSASQWQASVNKTAEDTIPSQPFVDCSGCHVDDCLDGNVAFCSWSLVNWYPHRFIGKTNKPLVSDSLSLTDFLMFHTADKLT